jgi:hypothetical protein
MYIVARAIKRAAQPALMKTNPQADFGVLERSREARDDHLV